MKEFKEQLNVYENFKINSNKTFSKLSTSNFKTQTKPRYLSLPNIICEYCKKFGHKKVNADKPETIVGPFNTNFCSFNYIHGNMIKKTFIENVSVRALVDTGSEKKMLLIKHGVELTGLGNKIVKTIGYTELEVIIDDQMLILKMHVVRYNDIHKLSRYAIG